MLKPVRLAMIVALVFSLLGLLGGISSPVTLLTGIVFLAAAFGLWRRAIWCGFGPALWLATQGALVLVVAGVSWKLLGGEQRLAFLAAAVIYPPAAWILYRAGRALAEAGAQRSFAAPWIALTTLSALQGILLVFCAPYVIPTGAMEETLLIGDDLIVPRFGARVPARGDIVVFHYPVDPKQTFVKRVIGMPGDRIRIIDKQTYLNSRKLDEPYVVHKFDYVDSFRDNFPSEPNVSVDPRAMEMLRNHAANGEIVVPPNCYFVMGDNRDSSLDSRYWGFVSPDDIIGKPWIVYWSAGSPNTPSGEQPSGWAVLRNVRWHRILTVIPSFPI